MLPSPPLPQSTHTGPRVLDDDDEHEHIGPAGELSSFICGKSVQSG